MEANSTQNGGGGGGGPASQPQLDDRKAAAQKLFDHYARLQEALRLNFERDLAKATGINSSAEADSENDPHHADKGSNKTHQHGAGAAMQINHVTGFLDAEDDSDSEESEDVEMPSPADPEHPGKPRKISVPSNGAKSLGRKKKVDNNEATALTKTIYAALELMKEKSGGAIAEGRKPTKPKTLGKHTRGGRSLPHILRRDSGPFGQMQLMDDAGEEAESGEEHGEDGGPVSKKPRIRASKIEFKRLDALYNKNIHDFYLAESNKTPEGKSDKWEEYLFIVRRQFGELLFSLDIYIKLTCDRLAKQIPESACRHQEC